MPTYPKLVRTMLIDRGYFPARLPGAKWVLVDLDGTLFSHVGVRNRYDESKVKYDHPRMPIVEWVRELSKCYNICILTGRHESCAADTMESLAVHDIPYDALLMRWADDDRPDTKAKAEMLCELLTVLYKEDIAFVLEDRPRVVRMWRHHGIMVIPVRGTEHHVPDCEYNFRKKYELCPKCGALEDF